MWWLYNIVFFFAYLALLPYFLKRMWKRGGYRRGFLQRLGVYPPDLRERLARRRRVWIHAVSVGELFVAIQFMTEWRRRRPDLAFLLTTTTSTGHALAEQRISGEDVLLYFPADFPPVIRRCLALVNPLAVVLVECELWPNFIRHARRRNIPVVLINGRISDRSFRRYRRIRFWTRDILSRLDLLCMQSGEDARRVIELGADPVRVKAMGTAKYDQAEAAAADVTAPWDVLARAGINRDSLLLVGGSTWPGEEAYLLDFFKEARQRQPRLRLVLVPRHAERAAEVAAEIRSRGLTCLRKSECGRQAVTAADVLLVDTTGELARFYKAATLIFVGKSLTSHGGQNVIEPAALGKPIVVGPNMENFAAVMDDFLAAQAIVQAPDAAGLTQALDRLLADPAAREELGRKARQVVRQKAGVVPATLEAMTRVCRL